MRGLCNPSHACPSLAHLVFTIELRKPPCLGSRADTLTGHLGLEIVDGPPSGEGKGRVGLVEECIDEIDGWKDGDNFETVENVGSTGFRFEA